MMLPLRFFQPKWPSIVDGYLHGGTLRAWEPRFLGQWVPLLLGAILGLVSAAFVASNQWYLAIPLVLLLPSVLLLVRYPFAVVMFLLLIYPFFKEDPSIIGWLAEWVFYRTAIPIALLVAVLGDWLGLRKRASVRFGIAELSMLYFLLFGAFSLVTLSDPEPRTPIRFYLLVVVPFCAYWLVRLVAPGEKDLRRLAWISIVVVVAQSLVGFLSWFSPHLLPVHWLQVPGRTSGTFGSPHPYTVTLTFAASLLVQYLVESRSRLRRFALLGTVALAFVAVFFSFSRGSWLGALLVILGLLVRYTKATASILIGVLLLGYFLGNTLLVNEFKFALTRLTTERTAENRIIVYASALRMIEVKPLLGWGFGNYERYDEQFKTRVGDIPAKLGEGISSHNVYMTISVEMGLIGLLLYLFPAGWWLLQSIRFGRRLPGHGFTSSTMLLMFWLAMLQQFSVSNFSDMFTSQPLGTTLWWMTLGLIASLVGPYATSDVGPERAPATAAPTAREAPR